MRIGTPNFSELKISGLSDHRSSWIGDRKLEFLSGIRIKGLLNTFDFFINKIHIPSGELSQFAMERSTMLLMGKSTISMAIFHIAIC